MVSNVVLRAISAIILGSISTFCILKGGVFFSALVMLALFLMLYEWFSINKNKKSPLYILGNVYLIIPMMYWLYANAKQPSCSVDVLWIFGIVCTCDIFAFLGGKLFKGPKFAPNISPNKTWSGVLVGSAFAFIFSYVYHSAYFKPPITNASFALFAIETSILIISSVYGDLLESKVKRMLGIKDTSNIIPGHGGVCDRLDSFLLATYSMIAIRLVTP